MENDKKVKIIQGEHKGKQGVVTSMLWATNTAIIKTDDNQEIAVNLNEIEN